MIPVPPLASLTALLAWANATAISPPKLGPLHGVGTGQFNHSEWNALLVRFVQQGEVDYVTMRRVERLLRIYLSRLTEIDPEAFIDTYDQLAFYLNAYNAIAIHQVLLHPQLTSIGAVPDAFLRPYPVGRRNVTLQSLHGGILRSFGDPRVHAAITPAARGAGVLPSRAYTGATLDAELDEAMRRLLADPVHGARYDMPTSTLHLSPIFRWFGGDFLVPHRMPSLTALITPRLSASRLIATLMPYLPSPLAAQLDQHEVTLRWLPFDWSLNGSSLAR